MDKIPILEGLARDIRWGADESGRFRAKDYYDDKLQDVERRRFWVAFEQVAEAGTIVNDERYRREPPDLHVFKAGKHRLYCFQDGRDVVLVEAAKKKSNNDKRLQRVLKSARRIRAAHLEQGR